MPRKQKIIQRGGMHGTPMPSEIYGKNSGRYFAEGSPNLNIGGSAYGANIPVSRGTVIGDNLMGPDLGPTGHSGTQTGGSRRRSKTQINRRRSKTQLNRRSSKTRLNRRRSKTQLGGRSRSKTQLNRRRSKTQLNRRSSKTQFGGSPFKMITNPETGRKVSIHGSIGNKVLRNYLRR
jgi:hypothetical protein